MTRQLLTLLLLLPFSLFYAQDKVNLLIEEGIKLHDEGNYKEAIECYKQALKLDAQNPTLNYEIAYSYDALGDFKKSIEYAKKAITYGQNQLPLSYVALGNAYDHDNKPEKAIKTYRKGLSYFPDNQLLHYNIACTFFNQKDYHEAFNHAEQSLLAKPSHFNSHVIINNLMMLSVTTEASLFPKYFMMLFNQNTAMQKLIHGELIEIMNQSIDRKDPDNINIYLSPDENNMKDFRHHLKTIIALFAAPLKDGLPENFKKYTDFNTLIFDELVRWYESEDRIKDQSLIYEEIYYPYFVNLHKAGHTEAFTFFILDRSDVPGLKEWKEKNDQKLINYMDWSNQ